MSNYFKDKDIKPMLIKSNVEPYNDADSIFELKLDGIRCLAYIDNYSVTLKNKRNKDVTNIYPELQSICENITRKCILDGEIIVLKNGKPNFFAVQKRSLMTDQFKINLAKRKYPVTFVAFDILYYDNESIMNKPLIRRKEILKNNIIENNRLAITRFIEEDGINLFEIVKSNRLEGIVAKKKDSIYIPGIRTNNWKKIKVLIDEDLIICGYDEKNNDINSIILGYYDNGKLICKGKASLGISQEEKKIIKSFSLKNRLNKPLFDKYSKAIWIKPMLVGTVEYMHETDNNQMRQPIWKGLRLDKDPNECSVN
ncbi:MAG: DNA ligase [Anaeroplasma sp.]